jgi:hypothetical protein
VVIAFSEARLGIGWFIFSERSSLIVLISFREAPFGIEWFIFRSATVSLPVGLSI